MPQGAQEVGVERRFGRRVHCRPVFRESFGTRTTGFFFSYVGSFTPMAFISTFMSSQTSRLAAGLRSR